MRHKVLNLQSIHLLKMCCNPFTHFLIASQAHAKCWCCAILAILPFVILLIAEDETRNAELVQAILLSYLFFVYSSEPFCLSDLFPVYHLVTHSSITSFFFLYIILLEWVTIFSLVFSF